MAKESITQFQGKNEYFISGDTAEMVLCYKAGPEKCRVTIDAEDVERCAQFRWFCNNAYIVHYTGGGRKGRNEMKLHDFLLHFKGSRKRQADHINRDPLDNRKVNLRLCTRQQNLMNRITVVGETGFRGVYTTPNRNRWRAKIKHNGVLHQIGVYASPEEAAMAWNAKALELRGEFAVLNEV